MSLSRPQKIIVIAGLTASGKSELAVKIAKKYNGEIISTDSRQIYRGLDLGTGKVAGAWYRGIFMYKRVPHYCIDFVSPKKMFSVSEFKKCAATAIRDIANRGKIPILAGGTGFWIDAVVHNFTLPEVPPSHELRKQLTKKTPAELFNILARLDPKRSASIDPHNPRRLIRAIEIAHALGAIPLLKKKTPYDTLWLGIALPKEELRKKIDKRLLSRIKDGMIREAKKLHSKGVSWKRFYTLGLEYRFLADYLSQKCTKKQMIDESSAAIWRYAKRQKTWFKRNRDIHWVKNVKEAYPLLNAFAIPAKRHK